MPDRPPTRRLNWRSPPLPDRPPPFPTAPPLESGLADLVGLTLIIGCPCRPTESYLPCRMLAAQYGWSVPLHKVIYRLRCSKCRQPPNSVLLVDRPDRMKPGTYGPGPGSEVMRLV